MADVLSPTDEPRSLEWLKALAEFHEWPIKGREKIESLLKNMVPAGPEMVLTTLVQALFRFDAAQFRTNRPIILSGPPGSGKTVTLAKLAAAEVLAGHAVDIITLDVKRAGSLEQVSTLLEPLDLSPIPVARSADLPKIIAACKSDVVLVDTASTNPFNPADLGELSSLTARIGGDLVLVLAAGQAYADSADIARSYSAIGADAMIATKLDVARRFGGVLAAAEAGLAFTQAGIGPTIGDGLCALSAAGMARLLLRRYYSAIGEECAE
ncbi:MAG: hypothetical protein R3F54_01065 [Alphaproteobacteria bacterium]